MFFVHGFELIIVHGHARMCACVVSESVAASACVDVARVYVACV